MVIECVRVVQRQLFNSRRNAGFLIGERFLEVVDKGLILRKLGIKHLCRDAVDVLRVVLCIHPLIGFQPLLHDIGRDDAGHLMLLPFLDGSQPGVVHLVPGCVQFRPANEGDRNVGHHHGQHQCRRQQKIGHAGLEHPLQFQLQQSHSLTSVSSGKSHRYRSSSRGWAGAEPGSCGVSAR